MLRKCADQCSHFPGIAPQRNQTASAAVIKSGIDTRKSGITTFGREAGTFELRSDVFSHNVASDSAMPPSRKAAAVPDGPPRKGGSGRGQGKKASAVNAAGKDNADAPKRMHQCIGDLFGQRAPKRLCLGLTPKHPSPDCPHHDLCCRHLRLRAGLCPYEQSEDGAALKYMGNLPLRILMSICELGKEWRGGTHQRSKRSSRSGALRAKRGAMRRACGRRQAWRSQACKHMSARRECVSAPM